MLYKLTQRKMYTNDFIEVAKCRTLEQLQNRIELRHRIYEKFEKSELEKYANTSEKFDTREYLKCLKTSEKVQTRECSNNLYQIIKIE